MKFICKISALCFALLWLVFFQISCSQTNRGYKSYKYHVKSIPSGAKIYLDEKFYGLTPASITLTGDWVYEIQLKKHGYQTQSERFSLDANERETFLLKSTNSSIAKPIKKPQKTENNLYYRVLSNPPEASIYLDGIYQGITPKSLKLSNDIHKIEITKDGFQRQQETFSIDNNETYTYNLQKNDQSNYSPPKIVSSTISIDNSPPEIIIFDLSTSRAIKRIQKRIAITGRAIDKSGIVEVSVDNKEVDVDSEGFFSANVLLAIGKNDIMVRAMDRHKNVEKKYVTVIRENNGILPEIAKTNIKSNAPAKRKALVIGNAAYTYGGNLRNSVHDAVSVQQALQKLGFTVSKYENCTQKKMKKVVDNFGKKLSADDIALFFYAGHGVQVQGINYLIPVDAKLDNENDVEYDCVRADRILAKMENAGSRTNIVILDACRDNPFERSWRRGAKGSGLAFMNAPSGSIIAYATSPGNTASDGSNGFNGLYTSALLKFINEPNITIEEVFKKIRVNVMQQSGKRQVPWESTSLTGYFYFKKE